MSVFSHATSYSSNTNNTNQVRALLCLTKLLDSLFQQPPAFKIGHDRPSLVEGVQQAVARILPSVSKSPLSAEDLPRGKATTPLAGIDVPFHSSFMKDGIPAFRQFLYSHIACNYVDPQRLIRRYVPNLTARLFDIDKDYFEATNTLTGSPVLTKVLNQVRKLLIRAGCTPLISCSGMRYMLKRRIQLVLCSC